MMKNLTLRVGMCLAFLAGGSFAAMTFTPGVAIAAKKKGKKAKKAGAKKAGDKDESEDEKKDAAAAKEEEQNEAEAAQKESEERKAPAQFDLRRAVGDVDMDSRADQKRDEAIEKLKKLLPTYDEGPQKADLVFRLSEMYWAKSKYNSLRAMQAWDQKLDEWNKNGAKGPQPELERIAEYHDAKTYKDEALKLYERILEQYPEYQRKDEVLYNLGSSLYDSGDKKRGVEMYWTLIKQYPDSTFTPDAWLQLGEHFFNANKLTNAIKAYSEAAKPDPKGQLRPRIYSFAMYKLAWCDFNLQEYDQALDKFRKVVDYAKKQKGGDGVSKDATNATISERDRVQLLDEALNDMVRAYSHLDAVEDAFDYYGKEVGKEKSYRYMHRLARRYNDEGKYALEIKTYQRLNTDFPYAPEAPSNQTSIMNSYAQLGRNDEVRKEVRRLIDLYSPNGPWAKRNESNQKVLTAAFEIVEGELAKLVTEQHRAAQQTKLVETYQLARDIYKDYLDKFPGAENTYRFRFFYSEILFELKEFPLAAEQYAAVVAANPSGEFVKPAAYTAILAWEKVLSGEKEELGTKIVEGKRGKARGDLAKLGKLEELKKGKKYDAEQLSAVEQKLADSCDAFVKIAPNDDEVVKVKFKSARLYYINNQFEQAAARFGEIIDRFPKDALAKLAAESILESFNVRSDWAQLNAWSRKFSKNDILMADKPFADKAAAFVEGASFNEILFVYEPKGDAKDTGDRYAAFVKEFPKSKYVMVGLFNSIVNYDKSNLLEKSLEQAEIALTQFKDFKLTEEEIEKSKRDGQQMPTPAELREKVLFMTASFHERLAQFDQAAAYYEQFAKEFPKGAQRADAIFNAALFREGLGEYDVAIKNFESYMAEYPKKKDIPDIAWRIGVIHEKKKDYTAAQKHFETYGGKWGVGDAPRQLCADYKAVQAVLTQQKEAKKKSSTIKPNWDGLAKAYAKLSAEEKQKPCALEAMGAAAFAQLEPEYDEYIGLTITGSEKEMGEKLLKKLQKVDELQKKYTDVLAIGQGDFGIASLFRIGAMYQNLARAMFDTPCPKRLDEDQCAIYQAALQEKAFPLEEKAIEAFDKALGKAYELGLYNEWLAKTQEALKTYEPGRFPEVQTYEMTSSEAVFEVPTLVKTATSTMNATAPATPAPTPAPGEAAASGGATSAPNSKAVNQ